MKALFDIRGMHCAACQAQIERIMRKKQGVRSVCVNLADNTMLLEFDPAVFPEEQVIAAIQKAGFEASRHPAEEKPTLPEEAVSPVKRIFLPLVCLIPLILLSPSCLPWMPHSAFSVSHPVLTGWSCFLLLLPILFWERDFFLHGIPALFRGIPNMDTLVAVGSGAGILYSLAVLCRLLPGSPEHLYLDAAGMVLVLVSTGKYLEDRTKRHATDAIQKLMKLAPETASAERDGREMILPVSSLLAGDVILIRPGSSIPVDGTVTEGHGFVNQASLTGESVPVEKSVGDTVMAGTVNTDGFFKFRADRVGHDTALAHIIELVREAGAAKLPSARIADRVSLFFVPTVLILALLTVLVWLFCGAALPAAVSSGMTVLLISCPCALGLATPLAVMAGTGRGAEQGLLFRNGAALETLARIRRIVFDKTGTLTEGHPSVVRWSPAEGTAVETLIRLAASLEGASQHPFAAAIRKEAESRQIKPEQIQDFELIPGRGICGRTGDRFLLGGNAPLLREHSINADEKQFRSCEEEGMTVLYFAEGTSYCGAAVLEDALKHSAAETIRRLNAMNIQCSLLTGDRQRTAEAVARKLGIKDVKAEVLPQEKEQVIRSCQEQGETVAMAGDGINDAPALTRADVGIALGCGTDIAMASADVVLMNDDLLSVAASVRLSRQVVRNIRLNLFWAFFYNVLGIPLAAGVLYPVCGWLLPPAWGAAAMSASSLCVVLNALRLRYKK